MKIHRLQVTIDPGDYANWKRATIVIEANNQRVKLQREIPDDDFISRFDWLMEDAKQVIKDKFKQP